MLERCARRPLATLALIAFALMLPAFMLGAGGIDLHEQSLLVRDFNQQFWSGDMYPRWLQNMFAGDGSPAFFYYPPLAYFITAFFAPLSTLDAFGFTAIAASAFLAVLCSGLAFYAWMKAETQDTAKALLGAALYLTAPHHVAQNFYYCLLFSSVWSYAWAPLLLLYARKLALQEPYGVAGFALFLALLVLTNLPMTAMFAPLAVAYCLLHFDAKHWRGQSARLICAIALGFALASIYLIPALCYQPYANVGIFWKHDDTFTNYNHSYFFIGFSNAEGRWYQGYSLAAAALTALYFTRGPKGRVQCLLFCACLLALFLMLPVSVYFWEKGVKILQFAERLFAVHALCLAALAAFALPRLRAWSKGLVLACVMVTVIVAAHSRTTLDAFRKEHPAQYDYYALDIDQYPFYLSSPELIKLYTPDGIEKLKARTAFCETLDGDATVEITRWRPRDKELRYRGSKASLVRVRQFYFPGLRAFLNGAEIEVARDEENGEALLHLPAGAGGVELRLTKLMPELAGEAVSMAGAAVLLLMVLTGIRNRRSSASKTQR